MVEKVITPGPNVIDFARYQFGRIADKVASTSRLASTSKLVLTFKAPAMSARTCRHCNAVLLEGENEDECSGALNTAAPRKFYAE